MADAAVGLDAEHWDAGSLRRGARALSRTRGRRTLVLAAIGAAVLTGWAIADPAAVTGLTTTALLWGAAVVSAMSWPVIVSLVLVSVLHYVAAAAAARAAAGVRLPFGELLAAQLAAAAVNRVTPAGLGGATLLGRYFNRRGRMRAPEAAAAVSSLAVAGAVADVLAFAALVGVGTVLGVAGARSEVPLLMSRLASLVPVSGSGWLWVAVAAAVVVSVAACLTARRPGRLARRTRGAVGAFLTTTRALLARPSRVALVMATSASTTLLLAVGFAAAATSQASGLPLTTFGALMIGYMVAAAAGNATPTPGGVGAVDAALAGVLLAAGVHAAAAVGIVLAFRLITFWSPALVGLGLLAPLRRRGAF